MQLCRYVILIHYGELGLKGRNQPQFRRRLRDNVQHALRRAGVYWPVKDYHAYFAVPVPDDRAGDVPSVLTRLRDVCGVVWVALAEWRPRTQRRIQSVADLSEVTEALVSIASHAYLPGRSFCVRVTRADKSIPFTSPELETQFGALLREKTLWNTVSLKRPDQIFHVDISREGSLLYTDKLRAPGGLPAGTAGRVLLLLSGGIDSPVAGYLMAKRGCTLDLIHFTAAFTSEEEIRADKIFRLASRLSEFAVPCWLHVAPYAHFDLALLGRKNVDFQLILFRRFMARVAEKLAHRIRAEALVSGDNLSQVASQTLSNLVATSRGVSMPLFRPLIGLNKEEIVQIAQQIGTYDDSIAPYKDCCALISQNPRTRSYHDALEQLEGELFPQYDELIDKTLADTISIEMSSVDRTPPRRWQNRANG